jgi:streptogramin lyase
LFTDVVGSTELARELGDERWARLLAAQRRVVREQLRAHRGREVDTAGDGFFAVFEGPADAVRCAFSAARKVQDLGLDIRAGVHFGELEMSGKTAHGIVVHTGARVMGNAGAAQVLITSTVRDLVAGAKFGLRERPAVELKGVPGSWTLFDVLQVDDQLRPEPIEGATVASERRERASAGGARGRSRRWFVPAAVVAVLAIGAGLFVALKPNPSHVPTAGTIARIQNETFAEPIAVGSFPLTIIEGGGRVWVLDRQSQIYWVDEASGRTGSRGTDGVPTGAVFGGGAVWITAGFGGGGGADATVSRLEPGSGELTAAFHTPIDSQAIAFGGGSVWVADANVGAVTRYDTVSRETETIPLPAGDAVPRPDSIAYSDLDGGTVWVGDSLSNNVFRLDAAGSDPIRTYTIGATPSAVVSEGDGIWVASERGDAVYELDPSSGSVRNTIDLRAMHCSAPTSIAVTDDGVWVACSRSHQVIRVSSEAGDPLVLPVDGVPASLAAASDGSVFVAVQPR